MFVNYINFLVYYMSTGSLAYLEFKCEIWVHWIDIQLLFFLKYNLKFIYC